MERSADVELRRTRRKNAPPKMRCHTPNEERPAQTTLPRCPELSTKKPCPDFAAQNMLQAAHKRATCSPSAFWAGLGVRQTASKPGALSLAKSAFWAVRLVRRACFIEGNERRANAQWAANECAVERRETRVERPKKASREAENAPRAAKNRPLVARKALLRGSQTRHYLTNSAFWRASPRKRRVLAHFVTVRRRLL